MADNRRIGIFDSGVGGLSVLKEVKKSLPGESVIFFADKKNIPYGSKSKKEIKSISAKVANFLYSRNVKMIVVACNTATCYTIGDLRKIIPIPIIGTVPAIKPASLKTKKNRIAVLCTPATAKSDYLKSLINRYAKNKSVLKVSCIGLEESIENHNRAEATKLIKIYAQTIKEFQADVSVLGCTHYPLVREEIKKELGDSSIVLDSGLSIAKRVKNLLKKENALSGNKQEDLYFASKDDKIFSRVSSIYLNQQISAVKVTI